MYSLIVGTAATFKRLGAVLVIRPVRVRGPVSVSEHDNDGGVAVSRAPDADIRKAHTSMTDAPNGDAARTELYSFAATDVTLNRRTAAALEVWFADPEAIKGPGLSGSAITDVIPLDPKVRPCETARWALAAVMVVLLVVSLAVKLGGGGELWWVAAAVLSGLLAAGADTTARHYRAKHENRIKLSDQLHRGRIHHIQTNPIPPELKLALHVAQTAHAIERSPAFTSEYLTAQRRRVNLIEEVARLSHDSRDLRIERRHLIARDDIGVADASPLLAVLNTQEGDLKAVWAGLVTRAEALDRYLATVREIEPRLTYLAQLESATHRSSRITELKLRTLEHTRAANEMDAMSAELTAVREAIDELVRGLDRDAAIIEQLSIGGDTK